MADVKQNQVEQKGATDRVYRIAELYKSSVVPALIAKFGYKNVNEVPKMVKIVLNMGLGDIKDNSKSFELAVSELRDIAGQAPTVTKAKKSIANFKLREGMKIGAKVTLRVKGVPADSFDGRGNYAMGIKEQLVFPEISYDKIEKVRGFDVCIVTTAKTDEEAKELLQLLGMPFVR